MGFRFTIEIQNQEFVLQRWDEIEYLIIKSFNTSDFNENLSLELVLSDTRNGAPKPLNGAPRPSTEGVKNIIAFNDNGEIIGAIFSVSTLKSEGEIEAIVGWFLTSPDLSVIKRVRVIDALIQRRHQELKQAGCKKIITDMGTKAGALYLQRRFGYVHSPTPDNDNRWILDLSEIQ